MVSSLNRQRVINFLDRFDSGDIEAALACCRDDIEFMANAPVDILPHMGHRHGKDEVRQMWQAVHARYSNLRRELRTVVTDNDKVAIDMRAHFKKRSNGRIVQFDMAAFYTFKGGRITHIREILDTFDLVQQVLECDLGAALLGDRPGDSQR